MAGFDLSDIAFALMPIGVLGITLGRPLWVAFTDSPSDIVRIKVLYESLDGPAGPNTKVLSVERSGTYIGGRYSPPGRKYSVKLQKPDGRTFTKTLRVDAGLFGEGSITED